MSTILRKAPPRTINALRQIIISHIEKMKDGLIADQKNNIAHAKDEIEAAKINAIFHKKLGFLYLQLAEELAFFNADLKIATELDEEERIEFLRKYFAAKRRMIAANSRMSELESNDIGWLEIILNVFIIAFWTGFILQIRKNERLYSLATKAGIDEFEKNLSKMERNFSDQAVHIKKDPRRTKKGE